MSRSVTSPAIRAPESQVSLPTRASRTTNYRKTAIRRAGPPDRLRESAVDIEHPEAHTRGDDGRNETETQRLDRNWSSLLQELRVAQTGVQLLTGFLLILPFTDQFHELDVVMRTVYLVTVACSIGATILLIAPVSMHRLLFRRRRMKELVSSALIGMSLLGIALAGVATIIFDTVAGRTSAWIAGGASLVALAVLWYALPLGRRGSDAAPY